MRSLVVVEDFETSLMVWEFNDLLVEAVPLCMTAAQTRQLEEIREAAVEAMKGWPKAPRLARAGVRKGIRAIKAMLRELKGH